MDFKQLHYGQEPLLIGNVWDVPSARIFEQLNFAALGTSSAAIACMLGYEDGEQLAFSELEFVVKRITANTDLPLSVDIEAGYGFEVSIVLENIKRLSSLGVVGINIEDSIVEKGRELVSAEKFGEKVSTLKSGLRENGINIFFNVRSDPFLLGVANPLAETQRRVKVYEQAGADGIFVPCIETEADISKIVQSTDLPINVMCMPNLPDFKTLKRLGVKRISMGNFLHASTEQQLKQSVSKIIEQQSFKSVF